MKRTIIIHKTANEEPPKDKNFLVGYNREGENLVFPCRFSECREGWSVGNYYWNQTDLAKLYPYWMEIPDFNEYPPLILEPRSSKLKGFPEDETLPEDFTEEDLVQFKYRTDVQRILRRILMEIGYQKDGMLLYPLSEKPFVYICVITDSKEWAYESFLQNEVVLYMRDRRHFWYHSPLPYGQYRNASDATKAKQILSKLKKTIQSVWQEYPSINKPHDYDPEPGFGIRAISLHECQESGLISNRTANALLSGNIHNINSLMNASVSRMEEYRNIGIKTIKEILAFCDKFKIKLNP